MISNRRKPVARYVQFRDQEAMQQPFVERAEAAYAQLMRADGWNAEAMIDLPSEETDRRGIFRRPREAPAVRITVSPALAEAHRVAAQAPAEMNALAGCMAGRRLAALIAEVLGELVADLTPLDVTEQKTHPAYRQTLRLTAELTALVQVTDEVGCADPLGCVAVRGPQQWGRREEDVEVTEVRAVLLELAHAAARGPVD